MDTPKIMYFDIETSLCLATVWGTGKTWITPQHLISEREIICMSWAFNDEKCIRHADWGQGVSPKKRVASRRKMLKTFLKDVEQADIIVAHNGKMFDIPIIRRELIELGLPDLPPVVVEDTFQMAKGMGFRSLKLDDIAKTLGLDVKIRTSYSMWQDLVLKGNPQSVLKKMVRYCDQDIRVLRGVYNTLLPFFTVKTHRGLIAGHKKNESCPNCGSKRVTVMAANPLYTTTAGQYLRLECSACGKRFKSSNQVKR